MGSRNAAKNKKGSRSGNRSSSGAPRGKVAQNNESTSRSPLLDGGMRDDLTGIALALIGVVLFVAVIMPSDAPVTSAISGALKHVFGLGAYFVPLAFVLWGASYFLKTEETKVGRLIIGVSLILLAVMGLLSLFNPTVDAARPDTLFLDSSLVTGGGYLGGGLAWVFLSLFGQIIACVLLVALVIVGLVLAGVSISVPFLFVKNFIEQGKEDDLEQTGLGTDGDVGSADADAGDTVAFSSPGDTAPLRAKKPRSRKRAAQTEPLDFSDAYDGTQQTIDLAAVGTDGQFADDASKTVDLSTSKKRGAKVSKPSRRSKTVKLDDAQPRVDPSGFVLPPLDILKIAGPKRNVPVGELKQTASLLQQTLGEFSLPARVVGWQAGPTVTLYKVELPSGVRLARLVGLADDIALSLAASSVRIAQIPNTSLVGVEIPNKTRTSVLLGDIVEAAGPAPREMAIGEDVDGNRICVDLAKMPHLLVAGTTGSGKSISLNGMIMTMLMRATPDQVRMIMVDPKRVEFSLYNGIPHLLVPPVTEPKEAASALKWAVAEMERRLKVFEQVGARNIGLYNDMIRKGELTDDNGDHPDELPYIVVIIDELSDLMMVAGKEVEDSIVRISQLARAAGIHLIVATQRPTSNVVTGMIKANITNRIALTVSQAVESRVIIDQAGAEKLTGMGDMLFVRPEWNKPKRIQGCYVSEAEISSVVEHLKQQGEPEYHNEILKQAVGSDSAGSSSGGSASENDDPLIWEAADAVVAAGLGSTSMLQRRLKVGYARAGRIMDQLELKGIVGPQEGSRARDVLIDTVEDLEALRAFEEQDQETR